MPIVKMKASVKKPPISPELNLVDFNVKVMEILRRCQDEINYRIIDGVDYPKSVQRQMLQEDSETIRLERYFMEQSVNSVKDAVANGVLPLIISNTI